MSFDVFPLFRIQELVKEITEGGIDQERLKSVAREFKIDVFSVKEFSNQKLIVLHALISHILRESDDEYYEKLFTETENWVKFNLSKKAGYECTFAGCLFHGLKHRDYVKHLQDIHFLQRNFV